MIIDILFYVAREGCCVSLRNSNNRLLAFNSTCAPYLTCNFSESGFLLLITLEQLQPAAYSFNNYTSKAEFAC